MTNPRHGVVIVASTRASLGQAVDTTGPRLAKWLSERGWTVTGPIVVADGAPVGHAVRSALSDAPSFIVTTGGTGLSPSDRTVEQVRPLLTVEIPGIMEEFRRRGAAITARALLSRGIAGLAGNTIVVTLPGSAGAVEDGIQLLDQIIDHLLAQVEGNDHDPVHSTP